MSKTTVVLIIVAKLNVAVTVIVPFEFSAIELLLIDKLTTGAVSFSSIVIVTDWFPLSVADPPDTEDIATIPVSSPS